jgi:hypothetical protein
MGKFDAAIPSSYATAAARVITTQDALLHGVIIIAGATATAGSVVVYSGTNTSTPVFACAAVTSGGTVSDGPVTPTVCAGGIRVTCTGTAYNHVVLYTNL